jgi:hypothetical protein
MTHHPKRPPPPVSGDVLISDFALDGLALIARYMGTLQEPDITHVGAALALGGSIEARVNSRAGFEAKVSIALVGPKGSFELSSAGGEKLQ